MRTKAERLAAEHGAEPAKAADHFVVDHEHVVLGADCRDFFEIGLRRHDHAARAHDGLGDEGRDRVGAFLDDQRVKFFGKPRRELFLAFAVLREPIGVRTAGMQKAGQRQVEIAVIARQAGERSGHDA